MPRPNYPILPAALPTQDLPPASEDSPQTTAILSNNIIGQFVRLVKQGMIRFGVRIRGGRHTGSVGVNRHSLAWLPDRRTRTEAALADNTSRAHVRAPSFYSAQIESNASAASLTAVSGPSRAHPRIAPASPQHVPVSVIPPPHGGSPQGLQRSLINPKSPFAFNLRNP